MKAHCLLMFGRQFYDIKNNEHPGSPLQTLSLTLVKQKVNAVKLKTELYPPVLHCSALAYTIAKCNVILNGMQHSSVKREKTGVTFMIIPSIFVRIYSKLGL